MKSGICSWCGKSVNPKKSVRVRDKSIFVKMVCGGDGSFNRFYHPKCLTKFRKYIVAELP